MFSIANVAAQRNNAIDAGWGGIYRRKLSLSEATANGNADAPFAFILLDLRGPDASNDSSTSGDFDEAERSALTIRLFGPDTSRADHLIIWPESSFNRDALQSAALDHWNFNGSSLPAWQKLADLADSHNDSAPISNQSIAMVLDFSEAGLLNYLKRIKPPDAPSLLIENWFGDPQLNRFAEEYSGNAYALVPTIPEPSLRSFVQDYPDLISLPALSNTNRIRRLWTLFALDRINQVLRKCGRDLTIDDFVEYWRNLQSQDRDRVRLILVSPRSNPHGR